MGWGLGGRLKREGTYVYLWLIHVGVQQKLVQYCKATILQLKKKKANSRFQGPLSPPGAGPHVRLWIDSETETRD